MNAKKLVGWLHRWLGLASGLVVFMLGITGCILVFEQEIRTLTHTSREKATVPRQNRPLAQPSTVFRAATKALPANGTSLYYFAGQQPNNVLVTWYYVPSPDPNKEGRWTALTQNPYTGEVITTEAWSEDFWGLVTRLHTHLLLPRNVGGPITGYATIIFVVLLISGLILWYPKSKKGLKQRFTVKWGASPKRLNYDLHNVLGFYMTWIVLFTALTGLVFSFEWFRNGVYYVATGGETLNRSAQPKSVFSKNWRSFTTQRQEQLIDSVARQTLVAYPIRNGYTVSYPIDSTSGIDVSIMTERGKTYDRHDEFSFDRYTGKLIASQRWSDQNAGERISHLNYAIHVGSVGGLPTKLLAFFASLIAASLPVTGFLIWWGRRKKKQTGRSRPVSHRVSPYSESTTRPAHRAPIRSAKS